MKPIGSGVFSPVKWQREKKRVKMERLVKDRAALPILNREEIIAYRLPFHEAIVKKLEIDGYEYSAQYLRELIEFQESNRLLSGIDSIAWLLPRLIHQPAVLEHIKTELQKAEDEHFLGNLEHEFDIILKLALDYGFGFENWVWLGHQLMFLAMQTCESLTGDRGKRHALARYVFGRFLLQKVKEPKLALEHLKIARINTKEKSWNINLAFPEENNTIFAESCKLIANILLSIAQNNMNTDPHGTVKICDKARRRALEGCYHNGVVQGYLLKGKTLMILFDTKNAIKACMKGLEILEKDFNVELTCEALKNLSMAYLKNGNLDTALNTLNKLHTVSQNYGQTLFIAQAQKYLGEYYLKEGTARNATPLLTNAVNLFDKAGDVNETAKTRNLAAISVGIELMPMFSVMLRKSDPKFSTRNAEMLEMLIKWKDNRQPFWNKLESAVRSISTTAIRSFDQESSNEVELDELEFLIGSGVGFDANIEIDGGIFSAETSDRVRVSLAEVCSEDVQSNRNEIFLSETSNF